MKPSICLMPRSVYCPLRHMSHSPTAQLGQGTGSGRRTIPTTRSPGCSPLPPGSTTRPSDSWPRTSRSRPGGAQPYAPEAISTSVPQMPTATASTRIDPERSSGSGTSSYRAESATPGWTVTAFTLLLLGPAAPGPGTQSQGCRAKRHPRSGERRGLFGRQPGLSATCRQVRPGCHRWVRPQPSAAAAQRGGVNVRRRLAEAPEQRGEQEQQPDAEHRHAGDRRRRRQRGAEATPRLVADAHHEPHVRDDRRRHEQQPRGRGATQPEHGHRQAQRERRDAQHRAGLVHQVTPPVGVQRVPAVRPREQDQRAAEDPDSRGRPLVGHERHGQQGDQPRRDHPDGLPATGIVEGVAGDEQRPERHERGHQSEGHVLRTCAARTMISTSSSHLSVPRGSTGSGLE